MCDSGYELLRKEWAARKAWRTAKENEGRGQMALPGLEK